MSKGLWKTRIVIWSDFDPSGMELETLAHDATDGESYCSRQSSTYVPKPESDREWDGTEFFDCDY